MATHAEQQGDADVAMQPEVVSQAGATVSATDAAARTARGALGEFAFGPQSMPQLVAAAAGRYRISTRAAGQLMSNCADSSKSLGEKIQQAAALIAGADRSNASGMGAR